MSKSLLFSNKEIAFEDIYFFCSTFICLAIYITVTLNDPFNISVIKILVVIGLTILHLGMGYLTYI